LMGFASVFFNPFTFGDIAYHAHATDNLA